MFTQLFKLNTEPTTENVNRAIQLLETYRFQYPELVGAAVARCRQLKNHIEVPEDDRIAAANYSTDSDDCFLHHCVELERTSPGATPNRAVQTAN